MIQKNLKDIEQIVSGESSLLEHPSLIIKGVSIDSRTIQEGNLFIPIIRIDDGHKYVIDAMNHGAIASLWQQDHPNPPTNIPLIFVKDTLLALQALAQYHRSQLSSIIIGITGSNGKTTTKDMISSILSTTFKVHKTQGSLNGQYGLPLTLLEIEPDTEVVILEMGISYPGEMERLAAIAQPTVVVVTMIGESHLSNFGSREHIADAKLQITNGRTEPAVIIFNGDERLLAEGIRKLNLASSIRLVRFGLSYSNNYVATSITPLADQTKFTLNGLTYKFPLIGGHNVNNALASIAVAEYLGITIDKVAQGLSELDMTSMRMEQVQARRGFTMINDAWNANPSSMKMAIKTFDKLSETTQKIIILGDMFELGDNEIEYHQEIGRLLDPNHINYVFTIGRLAQHIAWACKDVFPQGHVKAFQNKEEVINAVQSIVQSDSLILIKGSRGMKLEEVVERLQEI